MKLGCIFTAQMIFRWLDGFLFYFCIELLFFFCVWFFWLISGFFFFRVVMWLCPEPYSKSHAIHNAGIHLESSFSGIHSTQFFYTSFSHKHTYRPIRWKWFMWRVIWILLAILINYIFVCFQPNTKWKTRQNPDRLKAERNSNDKERIARERLPILAGRTQKEPMLNNRWAKYEKFKTEYLWFCNVIIFSYSNSRAVQFSVVLCSYGVVAVYFDTWLGWLGFAFFRRKLKSPAQKF